MSKNLQAKGMKSKNYYSYIAYFTLLNLHQKVLGMEKHEMVVEFRFECKVQNRRAVKCNLTGVCLKNIIFLEITRDHECLS